jgi:hypothetical protein
MDIQRLPGVDLVHDLNVHPWPIDTYSVEEAKAWHIVEHIPPVCVTEKGTRRPFMEFMDECWRVLQVGARIDIQCPYGSSDGFVHDPTHCNPVDEITFLYFDPAYEQYEWYQPKPWKIVQLVWVREGNVAVVLEKRSDG